MEKAFVVTAGEYSDYHVVAVFTTEQLAQAFLQATNGKSAWGEKYQIEQFPLDPFAVDMGDNLKAFTITMARNGDAVDIEQGWERAEPSFFPHFKAGDSMMISVLAKDEFHAVKIVNEKRAQLIATDQWGKL